VETGVQPYIEITTIKANPGRDQSKP
jgi:hypothetical protein